MGRCSRCLRWARGALRRNQCVAACALHWAAAPADNLGAARYKRSASKSEQDDANAAPGATLEADVDSTCFEV